MGDRESAALPGSPQRGRRPGARHTAGPGQADSGGQSYFLSCSAVTWLTKLVVYQASRTAVFNIFQDATPPNNHV